MTFIASGSPLNSFSIVTLENILLSVLIWSSLRVTHGHLLLVSLLILHIFLTELMNCHSGTIQLCLC